MKGEGRNTAKWFTQLHKTASVQTAAHTSESQMERALELLYETHIVLYSTCSKGFNLNIKFI